MDTSEKKMFCKLVVDTMASYGKLAPDPAILAAWWNDLHPYSLGVVRRAFEAYRDGGSEYPPVPAAIEKRCRLQDGRPTPDEAWAIALPSRDEAETVVWTQEIAEAFRICMPVFPDEIGARMAFKDAYSRLVVSARGNGIPAKWMHSLGWDMRKREASLNRAVSMGLLAAPSVVALLPAPVIDPINNSTASEQLSKIKAMLAESAEEKKRQYEIKQQQERAEIKRRKQELSDQASGSDDGMTWE